MAEIYIRLATDDRTREALDDGAEPGQWHAELAERAVSAALSFLDAQDELRRQL